MAQAHSSACRPIAELQRTAILTAMVEVVAERGYAGTSLGVVLAHANVSRRAFHECFESLEDCFVSILDDGMHAMAAVMADAFAGEESWLDGLLAAEAAVLSLLDSEPTLARVLLVESLGAGSWALERREQNVAALRGQIVDQLSDSPVGEDFPPLAPAAIMASLLGIIQDHLIRGEDAPLITLLGPLMGVITTPYLDPSGVQREIRRGEERAREILAARSTQLEPEDGGAPSHLPRPLSDPRAHRARSVLIHLASNPDASNRQIGDAIGVENPPQISTLLARLEEMGLVHKHPGRPGTANAWTLTVAGRQAALLLAGAGLTG